MRTITLPILLLICVSPATQGQDPSDDKVVKSSEQVGFQTFRLRHARAENVALILIEQFPPTKFSSDPLTNTIYARLSYSQTQRVLPFIQQLEQAAKSHQEENLVARENDEKRNPLRSFSFKLTHVDAHDMEKTLTKLGLPESGSVAATPSGNAIVLRFPKNLIGDVIELVGVLDTPSNARDLRDNQSNADEPGHKVDDLPSIVPIG